MWTTGLNNYGQLGLGHLENKKLLQHVAALDGKAITEVGSYKMACSLKIRYGSACVLSHRPATSNPLMLS